MIARMKNLKIVTAISLSFAIVALLACPRSSSATVVFDSFTTPGGGQSITATNSVGGNPDTAPYTGVVRTINASTGGITNVNTTANGGSLGAWHHQYASGYGQFNYGANAYTDTAIASDMNLNLTGATGITLQIDSNASFANRFAIWSGGSDANKIQWDAAGSGGTGAITFDFAGAAPAGWVKTTAGSFSVADVDAMVSYWQNGHITISEIRIEGLSAAEAVPEPSTFVLGALGLVGLGCVALRKKFRRA